MNGMKLLLEFDQEMANTRKMLERVRDEHLDFRPHEKSYSLRELAGHVATLPSWIGVTVTTTELDLDRGWSRPETNSHAQILAAFDASAEEARSALEATTSEDLGESWTLRSGEKIWFTLPRYMVYRTTVLNHLIHHRAQLSVYLRLLDEPVPGMYGPSADER